jgi:hypothetical protein
MDEYRGSVGVGGVFTITGVVFSPAGGVRGGRVVSTVWPLERRRNRSEALGFGFSGSCDGRDTAESGTLRGATAGSEGCCASFFGGRRSGLGLPVSLELFFERKTSLKRPTGEGDLPDCDGGSPSEDLLDFVVKGTPTSAVFNGLVVDSYSIASGG